MTYQITGINPDQLENIARVPGTVRVRASSKPGFPCRVTLEDAEPGEELLLFPSMREPGQRPLRAIRTPYRRYLPAVPWPCGPLAPMRC
jgi:hypothetical protein